MELVKLKNEALAMRLDIYFSLTLKQRRKFNDNYQWQWIEDVSIEDFKEITKSKKIIAHLIKLKDLLGKIELQDSVKQA